jgi:two-component system, NarL family, response regulator DevR
MTETTTVSSIDRTAIASLTACQREVLIYVGKGMTSDEIGKLLGRSRLTVQDHLKQIFAKLDVHTRVEAAVIAAKAGLL